MASPGPAFPPQHHTYRAEPGSPGQTRSANPEPSAPNSEAGVSGSGSHPPAHTWFCMMCLFRFEAASSSPQAHPGAPRTPPVLTPEVGSQKPGSTKQTAIKPVLVLVRTESRPVWYRRGPKAPFPGFLNTPNRPYALRSP